MWLLLWHHWKVLIMSIRKRLVNSSFRFNICSRRLFPSLSIEVDAAWSDWLIHDLILNDFSCNLIFRFFISIKWVILNRLIVDKLISLLFYDLNIFLLFISFFFLIRSQNFNFTFHLSEKVFIGWTCKNAWLNFSKWRSRPIWLERIFLSVFNSFLSCCWYFPFFIL